MRESLASLCLCLALLPAVPRAEPGTDTATDPFMGDWQAQSCSRITATAYNTEMSGWRS
jgi:hypothetical protein